MSSSQTSIEKEGGTGIESRQSLHKLNWACDYSHEWHVLACFQLSQVIYQFTPRLSCYYWGWNCAWNMSMAEQTWNMNLVMSEKTRTNSFVPFINNSHAKYTYGLGLFFLISSIILGTILFVFLCLPNRELHENENCIPMAGSSILASKEKMRLAR